MVHYAEIQNIFRRTLDLHNARVAELEHLFTIGANKVIVLAEFICLFELGHVLPKLVFDHQSRVKQYFDVVIQSRPAYPVFFVLHHEVQLLDVEMTFVAVNLIQDGETFGSLSVLIYLQVICQDLIYSFLRFLVHNDFKDTTI